VLTGLAVRQLRQVEVEQVTPPGNAQISPVRLELEECRFAYFGRLRGALRPLCDRLATSGRGQTAQVLAALAMAAEGSLVASGLEIRTRTRAGYLRIGEALQGLAAPGEVLTRLALPLKSSLPGPHRLFLGLTNDTLGYFVPEDEWMTGRNNNYEEYVSSGRQAAPALEAALQALMEDV